MSVKDPFERLLEELHRSSPGLTGAAREDWGSRSPGSRIVIRNSLKETIPTWTSADIKALDDLNDPPRPADWSVSISHAHGIGGWMAIPRPAQVGWDVELKARIKNPIIERVCKKEELDDAPERSFLWCAKEAYFKALEDEQPATIPMLTIIGWQTYAPGMWRWQGLGPRNGSGLLIDAGDLLMAGIVIP